MKRFLTGCLLACVVSSVFAQGEKEELNKLHQQYAKNLVAKDFAAIEKFYDRHIARDFRWIKQGQPVMTFFDMWENNRLDMLNKKNGVADGPLEFNMKVLDLHMDAGDAVITVQTRGHGEWHKDGQWIPVRFQMLVRERWRKQDGRWVAVAFQDASVKGELGKPYAKSKSKS